MSKIDTVLFGGTRAFPIRLFQFACTISRHYSLWSRRNRPASEFHQRKDCFPRDVQIQCGQELQACQYPHLKPKDSRKELDQAVDVVSTATEFVIERDAGEPFLFVQFNEEQLKAGERVLLLKEADKMRIVRDRATK